MRKSLFALWTTFLLFCAPMKAAPPALDVVAAKNRIDTVLNKSYPRLERLYQDIHSHPEVGFQESRTASLLAGQMRKLGFTVTSASAEQALSRFTRMVTALSPAGFEPAAF